MPLKPGMRMTPEPTLAQRQANDDVPPSGAADLLRAGGEPIRLSSLERNVTFLSSEPKNNSSVRLPTRDDRARYEFTKRLYDLGLGVVMLVIATPIILIAALLIRLETKGSPFFIQTRVGRNGRLFKIIKLRGMFIDSRIRFPSFYDYSGKQNLDFCFHHESDPRVTKAGALIRKTSIDELPNFWNVVMGDMSLVGPRPEIPEVMALYGEYRERYVSVKPGITCLSKCTGRDRLTKRQTIEYDLDYVRRRSFKVDISILWKTFRGVILRRDVY